jgi:hypothetical protein
MDRHPASESEARRLGVEAAAFVALTFGLTLPFLIVGAATGVELLPGLPLASLAIVCPAIAAVVVAKASGGKASDLLRRTAPRAADRPMVVWIAAIGAPVAVAVASFAIVRVTGAPIPRRGSSRLEPPFCWRCSCWPARWRSWGGPPACSSGFGRATALSSLA